MYSSIGSISLQAMENRRSSEAYPSLEIQKRRKRFLFFSILTLMIGPSTYSILQLLTPDGSLQILYFVLAVDSVLAVALLLTLKGRILAANILAAAALSVSILGSFLSDADNITHLFIMVLPLMMASIQLNIRFVLLYSLGIEIAIISLTLYSAEIEFTQSFMPMGFVATVAALLCLNLRHRRELEEDRRRTIIQTRDATIYALAFQAELRDQNTGRHIERTRLYVDLLAGALSAHPQYADYIDDRYRADLIPASLLHDIGKVGVSDAILLKPGPLSEDEYREIQRHCDYGVAVITKARERIESGSIFDLALEIAQSHHERWNGSGYPHGLEGEAIPVSARIMALADVWDALTSRRPYKEPFPTEKSRAIILDGRASQFDPLIVDEFLLRFDDFSKIAREFAD